MSQNALILRLSLSLARAFSLSLPYKHCTETGKKCPQFVLYIDRILVGHKTADDDAVITHGHDITADSGVAHAEMNKVVLGCQFSRLFLHKLGEIV